MQTRLKTKKRERAIANDRCKNTCGQKYLSNGSENEIKVQEIMYRDTTNVEQEIYEYTNNNWRRWKSKEKLKEKFGSCTGKAFDRYTTKDSNK